ncbi:MAG: hypothetical protein ACOC44_19035 [Promethearchaeia archaeon]
MNKKKEKSEISSCEHKHTKIESGFKVCQDCGLILDDSINFDENGNAAQNYIYSDSQRNYERKIRTRDRRAKQDPIIKQKYDRIKKLEKWFQDSKTNFGEQKRTIDLLKSHNIGLNIDKTKYQSIKDTYLKYNIKYKKPYQNMVIIFLAIVWMEIKETTNTRIEEFIEVANKLGHKINKKMINNAMLKVKKMEKNYQVKIIQDPDQLDEIILKKIKILFQKDLNSIPYQKVKERISDKERYNRMKIEMQLLADKLLNKMPDIRLHNLNYKAFTAGLLYYIGQIIPGAREKKIFTQKIIEEATNFSSTTIRKKYKKLKEGLGNPEEIKVQTPLY